MRNRRAGIAYIGLAGYDLRPSIYRGTMARDALRTRRVDVPGKSGVRELHCAATNRGPSSHALSLVHQRKPDFTVTISRVFPTNRSYSVAEPKMSHVANKRSLYFDEDVSRIDGEYQQDLLSRICHYKLINEGHSKYTKLQSVPTKMYNVALLRRSWSESSFVCCVFNRS